MNDGLAIIGANGFIGRNLALRAMTAGWQVYCLSRTNPEIPDCLWLRHDVLGPPPVYPPGTAAVFYMAQSVHYREFPKRAGDLFGVNVFGAVQAAQAAKEQNVRLFAYASSGNVYAPARVPMTEDFPLDRTQPYGLSKIMAEEALDCFQAWFQVISIRIFGAYGPGQRNMLVWNILQRLKNGKPIVLAPLAEDDADGLRVSFIYNDDLAACLLGLAARALAGGKMPARINMAGPEAVSLRRLTEVMAVRTGLKAKFTKAQTPRSADLIADIHRLRRFGVPAFTELEEGLASFIAQAGCSAGATY